MRWIILFVPTLFYSISNAQVNEQEILQLFGRKSEQHKKDVPYVIVKSDRIKIEKGFDKNIIHFASEISPGYFVVKNSAEVNSYFDKTIGAANNYWKLSPSMRHVFPTNKQLVIAVQSIDKFKNLIREKAIDVQIISEHLSSQTLTISAINATDLESILDSDIVYFIDSSSKDPKEESPNSFQDVSVNGVNFIHHKYPHINGEGFSVSVKERTLDKTDIDLKNRIVPSPLEDPNISLHSNQMATIIAGGGNSITSSKGCAWASHISSSSFSQLLPDDNATLRDLGVSVQNHSYGVGIENYYGAEARAYDINVNNEPTLMHVFSSGNRGEDSDNGPYQAAEKYANLTGNMKMAKNVLVVGAHYHDGEIDPRNSRGPAYDGRIKPELVAFGSEGTSDGAAMATGIVLLMQQTYTAIHHKPSPAALLKAALVATADDMASKGIDFISGYGAINAKKCIELIQAQQHFNGNIQSGEQKEFMINVPSGVTLLRLAIAWNDPAAIAGTAKSLVNDLDLALKQSSSENSWLPWVLSSYPHVDSLKAPPKRKHDRLNNVEYITIENPQPGIYKALVTAFNLNTTSQDFYITYWADHQNIFQWTYPTSSDRLETNKEYYLRWENTFEGEADVEISINGNAFETIAKGLNLSQRFFKWTTPDVSAVAVLRMKITNDVYISDSFTISPSIKIQLGYHCEEELMLTWSAVPSADQYLLYALGATFLEQKTITNDTIIFLSKNQALSNHFAIAPVINSTVGLRSAAYDYTLQGVNCYYHNFLATLTDGSKVKLALNLSTTYNVAKIVFEEVKNGSFIPLAEMDAAGTLLHEYEHQPLSGGLKRYRARIVLLDGKMIFTNTAELYYANDETYLIFPNPVHALTEELQLLTDGNGLHISFYDMSGRVIRSQEIFASLSAFSVSYLTQGLYLYRIFRNDKPVASGRILVK